MQTVAWRLTTNFCRRRSRKVKPVVPVSSYAREDMRLTCVNGFPRAFDKIEQ
jgi:hypothetical protein